MLNQVVAIVGATGGIGTALANKLAPTGANLVLAARNHERLSANDIYSAMTAEPQAVPTDINIQPESHLFL